MGSLFPNCVWWKSTPQSGDGDSGPPTPEWGRGQRFPGPPRARSLTAPGVGSPKPGRTGVGARPGPTPSGSGREIRVSCLSHAYRPPASRSHGPSFVAEASCVRALRSALDPPAASHKRPCGHVGPPAPWAPAPISGALTSHICKVPSATFPQSRLTRRPVIHGAEHSGTCGQPARARTQGSSQPAIGQRTWTCLNAADHGFASVGATRAGLGGLLLLRPARALPSTPQDQGQLYQV